MPKKTVIKLKPKHRDYIWQDEEGDFWFWDSLLDKWAVLIADIDGGFYPSDEFDPKAFFQFTRIAASTWKMQQP